MNVVSLRPERKAPPELRLGKLLGPEWPGRGDRFEAGPDATPSPDAIVVEGLAKRYPNGIEAVRGISFRVGPVRLRHPRTQRRREVDDDRHPGDLVRPTGGRATVAGFDIAASVKEVRRNIGFAMQEVGLDELATGSEFLILQGRLHGLSRREAARRAHVLLELVDLEPRGEPAHRGVLGRDEAARRPRLRTHPLPADPLPRRADRGP